MEIDRRTAVEIFRSAHTSTFAFGKLMYLYIL